VAAGKRTLIFRWLAVKVEEMKVKVGAEVEVG